MGLELTHKHTHYNLHFEEPNIASSPHFQSQSSKVDDGPVKVKSSTSSPATQRRRLYSLKWNGIAEVNAPLLLLGFGWSVRLAFDTRAVGNRSKMAENSTNYMLNMSLI